MNLDDVVLVLAVVTVGITAGVMFCYQITIMPGLRQLPDDRFIETFQRFDEQTVRPVFVGLMFFGGLVCLATVAGLHVDERWSTRFTLLIAATVVYLVGVIVLTIVWHVPRNNALAALSVPSMTVDELAAERQKFEDPWVRGNIVRTLAAAAALALLGAAMVTNGVGTAIR
ncbi:MAG TPA: DUF1772 domain-containing protein [Ilumatobacter sp.]|nr:DUF1772 domain-containing protein [Ilumatobacter sp.]